MYMALSPVASPISSDVGNFDVIRAAYSNDPVSYVAADTFGWWWAAR